jgi:hypothetical protein
VLQHLSSGSVAEMGKHVFTELEILAGPSTPGVPTYLLYEFSIKKLN